MTTWMAAYRSAMMSPFEPMTMAHGPRGFADQTVRQVVRVRGEGERLRVRFSNLYGERPLVIGRVVGREPGLLRKV
ncbi:SGNH/GDSL hydrolase family protein, partial [Actinomadura kijaniata]